MARFVSNNAIDALLDYISSKADGQTVCAGQPLTYYEAVDPAAWQASTAYALGDAARPVTRNGFNYECTTAGTSAATEPTWPTTAGLTVTDGTAIWTARTARCLTEAVAMTSADFTKAAGDVSGRKHTVAQKLSINIHTTGISDHVALYDDTAKELLDVTAVTSRTITAGDTVEIPSWDHEVENSVAP